MLNDFRKRLAGYVHAAVEAVSSRRPGGDAALQYRDVGVAQPAHAVGSAQRRTVAIVAPHDAHPAPRH
jgi:hypothetical protein